MGLLLCFLSQPTSKLNCFWVGRSHAEKVLIALAFGSIGHKGGHLLPLPLLQLAGLDHHHYKGRVTRRSRRDGELHPFCRKLQSLPPEEIWK